MKIGMEVICIDAKGTVSPLKEGVVYVVQDLETCPNCKRYGINVGVKTAREMGPVVRCQDCSHKWWSDLTVYAYFKSERFVPLEEYRQSEEAVTELLESIEEPEHLLI